MEKIKKFLIGLGFLGMAFSVAAALGEGQGSFMAAASGFFIGLVLLTRK